MHTLFFFFNLLLSVDNFSHFLKLLSGIMFLRSHAGKTFIMKTLVTIVVLSAASFNVWSQNNDNDSQDVQSNQYRNTGKDSLSNQSAADSSEIEVLQKNQDQGLSADDDGNGLTNEDNKTQSGEKETNTPAVIQRTTSESGSPAILSGEDGKKRDGTNNVQRATPNIAGAEEISNTNLSEKKNTEQNRKTDAPRVKKQEEQPAMTAPESQAQDTTNVSNEDVNSIMIDTTTPSAPMTAKEKRKAKREERRTRRKD
jgi:hypothetical protein